MISKEFLDINLKRRQSVQFCSFLFKIDGEGRVNGLISSIMFLLCILPSAARATAGENSDAVAKQWEIAREQADEIMSAFSRFNKYLDDKVVPEMDKKVDMGQLASEFYIPATIKQKTAEELDLYIHSVKKSIELARHYPNPQRDYKECLAWMNVFDIKFDESAKRLAGIKGSNSTDSELAAVVISVIDLNSLTTELVGVVNVCILNKGHSLGVVTPGMRSVREEIEADARI